MQQIKLLFLFVFFALVLSGCGADDATRNNSFLELTAISIDSEHAGIANLTNNQFTAMGNYSGEFDRDISTEVTWDSSDLDILAIDSSGLATAKSSGLIMVTATSGNGAISASFPFTVSTASVVSLTVTPTSQIAPIGVERDFDVSGTFDDASVQNLNRLASWTSLNEDIAGVTTTGGATGIAVGTADIQAEWQGVTGVGTLTVTEAVLTELTITPADAEYPAGLTIQYTLTGTYSDGYTADLTAQTIWESSMTTTATVDNTAGEEGRVEMLSSGSTDMSASYTDALTGEWEASTGLQVNSSTLREIHIYATVYESDGSIASEDEKIETAEIFDIYNDQTVHLTARGEYSNSEEYDITQFTDWTSSDQDIVTISNSDGSDKGIAKPGSETGWAIIEASFDDVDIEFTLDVTAR